MSQLITLRSGLAGTSGGMSHFRESIKMAWRSARNRQATFGWLELLNSHPLFRELVKARPRLLYKIYRPYMTSTLNCAQRLAVLQDHYRFVFKHGLGPLVVRAARGPVLLGGVEGKSGLPYQLELCAIEPLEREGELVLRLKQGEDLVYSTAFSFFYDQAGLLNLGIGCMQGPQGEHGLQLIKDATRELHGLRPKNLMVRLLSHLGHQYGCRMLRLTGNANRALTSSATRKGKVHADYDALWQELDAQARSDGDFQLPCEAVSAPDMAAIPSKKRAEMRRRHETLEALVASARAGLNAPRFEAVPTLAPLAPQPAYVNLPANDDAEDFAIA